MSGGKSRGPSPTATRIEPPSVDLGAVIDQYLERKLQAALEAQLPMVVERFLAERGLTPPSGRDATAPPQQDHAAEFLSKREVVKVTGLSGTTLWRMVRSGTFPPPFH